MRRSPINNANVASLVFILFRATMQRMGSWKQRVRIMKKGPRTYYIRMALYTEKPRDL